tara:strand:+ start:249 stop:395 length:147 start_codon:yes stop_codon:yes gene_type:complete
VAALKNDFSNPRATNLHLTKNMILSPHENENPNRHKLYFLHGDDEEDE